MNIKSLSLMSVMGGFCLSFSLTASLWAEEKLEFDIGFLSFSDKAAGVAYNLDHFASSGGVYPGEYEVTVYVNDKKIAQGLVLFVADEATPGVLHPKVDLERLSGWGIVPTQAPSKDEAIIEALLSHWVPLAQDSFNFQEATLKIDVPQANLAPPDWLRTPPSSWESGIPALMVNYDYSGSTFNNKTEGTSRYDFLNLSGLFTWQGWRLRNDMNWSKSTNSPGRWNVMNTYLQRDYAFWQGGQFTVGQTSTDGAILDSVPFEGVMLQSDEGMINPEMSAFAPVISGIANSYAVVSVYQKGALIYQRNVPPGPFEFKDITRNYSGDVDVEIQEADGTVRRYTQATAQVPMMVRKGRTQYHLAAGRYYLDGMQYNGMSRDFISGSTAWGMSHTTTLFTGALTSQDYTAVSVGVGQYLPKLGSFTVNATHAEARFPGDYAKQKGQSYKFSYSRAFENTTVSLLAYRYATEHYYTFNDVQQMGRQQFYRPTEGNGSSNTPETPPENSGSLDRWSRSGQHQRSRLQLSVSQGLGEYGSVSVSGSRDDYWRQSGYGQNWSVGYSTSLFGTSVSVSAGYNKIPGTPDDKTFALNLSRSFGDLYGSRNTSVNYGMTSYNDQQFHHAGVSGSILPETPLSYSVSQGVGEGSESTNASLGYDATYGQMNVGYGRQRDNWQSNYGVSGGMVLHGGGVTLSKSLSFDSASALVEIPGTPGVKVDYGGVKTDWFGYAIVPNLVPYTRNEINIQMDNIPEDVEIANNQVLIVPRKGTLVKAPFNAEVGRRMILRLLKAKDKTALPFGTLVRANTLGNQRTGIVGDRGRVYLSGLAETGSLVASWGEEDGQSCQADFVLPDETGLFMEMEVVCH